MGERTVASPRFGMLRKGQQASVSPFVASNAGEGRGKYVIEGIKKLIR
jgi:hypothetical protein